MGKFYLFLFEESPTLHLWIPLTIDFPPDTFTTVCWRCTQAQSHGYKEFSSFCSSLPSVSFSPTSVYFSSFSSAFRSLLFALCPGFIVVYCRGVFQENLATSSPESEISLSYFTYLFIYFGYAGSSLLHGLFSSCATRWYSLVSVHKLLIAVASRCRAWALGYTGFGSSRIWTQ